MLLGSLTVARRATLNEKPGWIAVPQGVRLIVVIVHALCPKWLFYLGFHKICRCLFQKRLAAKADWNVQGPGCREGRELPAAA